jgi:ABC-type nitrate/sulfonate/bicarbonate transport system permease component
LNWLSPLALLAILLLIWEIVVDQTDTPAWLLPPPSAVFAALIDDRDILFPNALVTLEEVLIGFVLAVCCGIGLGIAIYRSPVLARLLYPLVIASQTVPIPALAPLLLVWFGYGLGPKVLVTALVGFFPLVVNTVEGLRATDRDVVNLLRSFGASRTTVFRLVELPSSLPAIFAGAKIAVAISVIGAGANRGAMIGSICGAVPRARSTSLARK